MRSNLAFSLLVLFVFTANARAVTIAWSPVGNAGNAPDPAVSSVFGAVNYNYSIGSYDVTNSQYVEFLNAKDATGADSLGLYNASMSNATNGGISFNSGNATGSKYSAIQGRENHPVNYVNWYDAARFSNWLNNGQGNGDTETGAYTLLGGTATPANGLTVARNAGATVFLPSENEWYKAAYYNPNTQTYFPYPTSSYLLPSASVPTGVPNSANHSNAVGNLTDVGVYTGTTSPYGAFDMGGNVVQWTETLQSLRLSQGRIDRGGAFTLNGAFFMQSDFQGVSDPLSVFNDLGFRVAMIPEPSAVVLAILGLGGLVGLARKRRRA